VDITERDAAVLTAYDVLFLDDTFVQILAEVDDRFVAVADFFAVDNPLFWCFGRYSQIPVNNCFQEFCPENFCQGFFSKEVFGRFYPL